MNGGCGIQFIVVGALTHRVARPIQSAGDQTRVSLRRRERGELRAVIVNANMMRFLVSNDG